MVGDPAARALTESEINLARSVYGDAIDYAQVRVSNRKWIFFQPRDTVMAPAGTIHFHPKGDLWREDFAHAALGLQGLFVHEMCHVWQHQRGVYLPLTRHPFCRYDYTVRPGWPLARYGLEQQAEIVRHAFLLRRGARVAGAPPLVQYETILPFGTGEKTR
ncbi:vgr related protein [uncultured Sphingomonas sp.]|uniref:vgr related protein n=1 Tax=uncultured Sphingomonas sp. TaxID=158754 RepID=UPI00262174C8|nr:vgr related protein [uncultured Sphingomonas sp.]